MNTCRRLAQPLTASAVALALSGLLGLLAPGRPGAQEAEGLAPAATRQFESTLTSSPLAAGDSEVLGCVFVNAGTAPVTLVAEIVSLFSQQRICPSDDPVAGTFDPGQGTRFVCGFASPLTVGYCRLTVSEGSARAIRATLCLGDFQTECKASSEAR